MVPPSSPDRSCCEPPPLLCPGTLSRWCRCRHHSNCRLPRSSSSGNIWGQLNPVAAWDAQMSGLERQSGQQGSWGSRNWRFLEAVRAKWGRRQRKVLEVLGVRELLHEEVTPSPVVLTLGEEVPCPLLEKNPANQNLLGTQQQTPGRAEIFSQRCRKV